MTILHRYIFSQVVRNFLLCSITFTCLFLFVDFFDRIDNILEDNASFGLVVQYFALKIPFFFQLTLPISMLVSALLTMGLFTRSSELTAMRASGFRLFWLSIPVFVVGTVVAFLSFGLSETVIPYTMRRVQEIYNIDIKQRNKDGHFDREKFWFREGDDFYSVAMFDSREDALLDLSIFSLDDAFLVKRRKDVEKTKYLGESLGWNMQNVVERSFDSEGTKSKQSYRSLPLPIDEEPEKFYVRKTEPSAMSYKELHTFIGDQDKNGLSTKSYLGDLYSKVSFPFINIIVPLLVIPFAVGSGRTKSLASASLAAVVTGFSYYVIHSLAIALSRAELWPPLLSAWAANIVLTAVGIILFLGAEAPE
ncbi:MAG: LPS export ABC transporter permease LptG [Bdellovibrionales bacterium]|nr:LPS export ABC transporter permease LptG [Bdellovibrionales bacterium]